jgi:uncharacterized protein YjaZ
MTNVTVTLNDCPKISKKLIDHFKSMFGDRVKLDPGNPELAQWAAYQGAFNKVIEYMEKANKLQSQGHASFAAHETNHNGRLRNDQFNSALTSLRTSLRDGIPFEGLE